MGCQPDAVAPEAAGNTDVAARIGDGVIRVSEVQQELQLRAGRAAPIPDLPVLLDDMIDRHILVEKAKAEGLDQDPELRRSWERLLIGRYKEKYLHERLREVKVADVEIQQRYDRDMERYCRPGKARLAILTLPMTTVMTAEERQEVVARMEEGKAHAIASPPASSQPGFGILAVKYSEDQVTRNRGGDTGWLNQGANYRWPGDVVRSGFDLALGAISDPIVTADSVHLVKKTDERPASQVPLQQVREQIRKDLLTEKIRSEEAAFADALRENITVQSFPEHLTEIRPPAVARKILAENEEPPALP